MTDRARLESANTITTYHNPADPVGKRHPINPHSTGRTATAFPGALILLALFIAGIAVLLLSGGSP